MTKPAPSAVSAQAKLALYGGPAAVTRPTPHMPWPPIDEQSQTTVLLQLRAAVSIPDRSGVIADLEDQLAAYFGVRYAVLTSSGTAALHSAYAAIGIQPGDEVIVPAYTFHATATPLLHLNATPVLVDSDQTGNIDPAAVEVAITPEPRPSPLLTFGVYLPISSSCHSWPAAMAWR